MMLLPACSGQRALMPGPNVYQGENAKERFTALPKSLRSNEFELFYVTDRMPKKDENGDLVYGYGMPLTPLGMVFW